MTAEIRQGLGDTAEQTTGVAKRPRRLLGLTALGLASALLLAFLFRVFLHWLAWNVRVGAIETHCGLVPLMAIGLALLRRRELASARDPKPDGAHSPRRAEVVGLALATWACVLQLLATAADSLTASGLALILFIHGLTLALAGKARSRILLPCVYFLLFMLPVRYPLEVFLGFPLRLLSTRVAAGALSAFGIPALRTGTVLTMPGFTLQIGSPCSGLNTITGVLMIVAFHSILTGAGWMEAAVLLLASLPAALLANALRIVAIGAVGSLGRADLALGVVHDWSGFVTFAVALAVLFVLATVLRRRRAEPGATPSADAHTDVPSVDRAWVLARVLTLLMAVGTADWILARSSRQGSLPDLHSFPAVIVAAQAAEEPLTDEERELQVDTGGQIVRRVYRTGEQTVWAALVTAGASWRVHHPPEFCYTAQGWTVLQNSVYEDPGRASYRELLAERDGERRVIQYWFTDGNRSTTNLMDRWFQGLAAAFRGQSGHPWLMVTLSARETDVEALDRLRGEIRKTADSWIAAGPGVPPSS